jgi:hypothetical protein
MGSALNFSELWSSWALSGSRRRSEKQRTDPEHGIRSTAARHPANSRTASGQRQHGIPPTAARHPVNERSIPPTAARHPVNSLGAS